MKTLRPQAAHFDRSYFIKRTATIGFGLILAVFLLQFYWVRELLIAEVVVAFGLVVVALIGAVFALACIAVLRLRNLGSGLKALGAHVTSRHRQPFAKTTVIGLFEAKEEVS